MNALQLASNCWRLQGTGQLASQYYMGIALDPGTLQYIWKDGTSAGNGEVSNANPYAHWWVPAFHGSAGLLLLLLATSHATFLHSLHRAYRFPDTLSNNPTYTCTIGYSAYTYDTYIGDNTAAQMQSSAYFKSTTKKNKCAPLFSIAWRWTP
jgi:hypothetical protein